MIDRSWQKWEAEADPTERLLAGQQPALVSLHFLRCELRRCSSFWVGLAFVGMLLGAATSMLLPAQSVGTVTLLLAHDPATESTLAMTNDVSLLRTRAVAARVIDRLGLSMTPDEVQASVTVVPESASVLVVTITGETDAEAVARADALSSEYLAFRRAQLESQSDALVDNYQERVTELEGRIDSLTRDYEALAAGSPAAQTQAADVLAQRSQLNAEITTLQQTIESTSLQAQSVLDASHVLDPPSVVPRKETRRLALMTGSGLVGGLGLGVGIVLFRALTSNRVRRRVEVATALAVPVVAGVGGSLVGGQRARLLSHGARARLLMPLVRELRTFVASERRSPARIALVSVGVPVEAGHVAATTAVDLSAAGQHTVLVDLSGIARLDRAVRAALRRSSPATGRGTTPMVLRRRTTRPSGDSVRGSRARAFGERDVVLSVVEADPLSGLAELSSWADRAVILLAAGRSSGERLRTAAELVRDSGVELVAAMMIGCAATDESLGRPDQTEAGTPLRGLDR